MKSRSFEGMTCSIASVLSALGDRWGALIMRDLLLGVRRFDDLQTSSGVTNATLSDRLKALERSGLIERRPYQSRPERFEYLPTAKGRDLSLVMQAMLQVGDRWNDAGPAGSPLLMVQQSTGDGVVLAPVKAGTGEPVHATDVALEAGPGADDLTRWRLSLRRAGR